MGLEKKRDEDTPPNEDGKDLMQSTLIALGWEESADGEGTQKALNKDEVIKQLKQENQALAKQLEEKASAIKDVEGKAAILVGDNDLLKAKIEQLKKSNTQPVQSVPPAASQGNDVKDLAEKLALQKDVNASLESKLKELASAREGTPVDQEKNEVELASKQAEIESTYEKLKLATSKIDEQTSTITAKETLITDQAQKIGDLDETVKELKQQVVDIIGENTGLGGEVQAKLEQLSQREGKIGQMEAKVRQQEEEISKARLSISTLRSENEELHYRIKEYESVVDKQKKDLLQTESDTSEGMGRLQQIIDEHKEELAALKKEKQAAVNRVETITKQVDDGEKKRIGVEAVLDKTSKDLAFYQEKYFEQKNRIKSLDAQVEELQRSNEQKSALVKDLEMARTTFDAAKKAMDAEAAKITADFDRQKAALAEKVKASEEGGIYKIRLEQAEAKIAQLETTLTTTHKSLQAAEKEAKDAKVRFDSLQVDANKAAADKGKLEEQLKVSKSKIEQLEKEVEGSSDDAELMEEVMKINTENTKLKEDLTTREKEIEKYKRRVNELQDAAKDKDKFDEEIRSLKIGNKELRRRLEKYEKL